MKQTEKNTRDSKGSLPNLGFHFRKGESLPFEINSFDRLPKAAQGGDPHRHSFYEIIFVSQGKGEHVVDFQPVTIKPPILSFISPGQVHFWRLDEPLQGNLILFTRDFSAMASADSRLVQELDFFDGLDRTPHLQVGREFLPELTALLDKLRYEYRRRLFGRASVLRAYLHLLLVEIQRRFPALHETKPSSASLALVRRFKQLVGREFSALGSVRGYADELGVSPGHLSDTVKAVTGRPAGEHIREEIGLEAKRLLAHTDKTVAEIAYELNFKDPSYFGRFFKRQAGVSPNSFRRQIREKYQIVRNQPL